jgi:hypothetical protein
MSQADVENLLFWRNMSFKSPENQSSRTLSRQTIHSALHQRIGNHRVGLGVGSFTRDHEIEYRLVGFARSVGNDNSKGVKGVLSRLAPECRNPARTLGQALPGQYGHRRGATQDVIQVPCTHVRNQGPCIMAPRTQDLVRGCLHSQRGKFGRCSIAPEGSRHVVTNATHISTFEVCAISHCLLSRFIRSKDTLKKN